ncbi:hypothetical protein [uncultured Algoriphagus sp.]|uniref:hypothetical protein n=1 Tax=uncultured Algoriphagus sp. TaxID=417365 RepID=UPI002594FC6C|nr:hypothetical protein [uncultured Algoriphagus sp.]
MQDTEQKKIQYTFERLEKFDPFPVTPIKDPKRVKLVPGNIAINEEIRRFSAELNQAVSEKSEDLNKINIINDIFIFTKEKLFEILLNDQPTQGWIKEIFSGNYQPSEEFLFVAKTFEYNLLFDKYFPKINYPEIDGNKIKGRISNQTKIIPHHLSYKDNQLESKALTAPCIESAKILYDSNIKELRRIAEDQIEKAYIFYNELIVYYNTQFIEELTIAGTDQLSLHTSELERHSLEINNLIGKLNYSTDILQGLKLYLISFVVLSKQILVEWERSYLISAELAKEINIQNARDEYRLYVLEVSINFNAAIQKQDKIFEEVINNCYDQGFGH